MKSTTIRLNFNTLAICSDYTVAEVTDALGHKPTSWTFRRDLGNNILESYCDHSMLNSAEFFNILKIEDVDNDSAEEVSTNCLAIADDVCKWLKEDLNFTTCKVWSLHHANMWDFGIDIGEADEGLVHFKLSR
jgi:hypothetical protein